jgi:two-component system, cell cycle response regulator DivK
MLVAHTDGDGLLSTWFFADASDGGEAARETSYRQDIRVTPDSPTILVVDDDLANLALAEALLQAEGFGVRVAMDAASMFAILKTTTPALILMDIQLPEVDGWELTRKLKADAATKEIPVIAITAYGQVGDENKAREAGFAEFLAKPIRTRELPAIIRKHLAGR